MRAVEDTVRRLVQARRSNEPALASGVDLPDAQAAYDVQDGVGRTFGWFTDSTARHWKSGGPSRDAILTHAPLPPQGVWDSPAEAGTWPFRLRGIEAELALRLARDVDREIALTLDATQAAAWVEGVCVSIEVVDSRWVEALDAPAVAKLADLLSHGALVLGDWKAFTACDWSAQECRVQIGAQRLVERRGSHPLEDPAFVLPAWLRHATRGGRIVPAGTVVTTGSWVGILHAAAGDLVTAEFPGIGHASVQL